VNFTANLRGDDEVDVGGVASSFSVKGLEDGADPSSTFPYRLMRASPYLRATQYTKVTLSASRTLKLPSTLSRQLYTHTSSFFAQLRPMRMSARSMTLLSSSSWSTRLTVLSMPFQWT
jgi:hypothetical protein